LQNTLEQEIKIEEQKEAATKAKQEEKTASAAFDADRSQRRRPEHRAAARNGFPFVDRGSSSVPKPESNDDEQNLPAKPGGFSPFGDEEEPGGEGRMTFLEHLDELRKRITHAVAGLLVGFILSFAIIDRVFDFVTCVSSRRCPATS
jgi:hypothetical protein